MTTSLNHWLGVEFFYPDLLVTCDDRDKIGSVDLLASDHVRINYDRRYLQII